MCDKMAISAYILKIAEKDPFLRLHMRAREIFNRHQFFLTNKQYVKDKLMQNETNLWSTFLVKTKYTNFKTDKYLNKFQEDLSGILRLRKYQTSLQNFSQVRTRLLNMTWSNLRFNV